jgi:hypothetical protein
MAGQFSASARLAMDDEEDRQALALLDHVTEPQLVLGVLDRENSVAVLVIEREGVVKLRDALTGWLDQ